MNGRGGVGKGNGALGMVLWEGEGRTEGGVERETVAVRVTNSKCNQCHVI